MNVLMVASECSLFAKVGGLADVVYELSLELSKIGCDINVIIPKYGIIKENFDYIGTFQVEFAGKDYKYKLYCKEINGVKFYFVENKFFFDGKYKEIYINSANNGKGPFEDDAIRFSFFSIAVLNLLKQFDSFRNINILHCHDWHTGFIFPLLKWDRRFSDINVRTVFTIHNLNYQGIRPFEMENDSYTLSSFRSWFEDLYNEMVVKNNLDRVSYPSNIFEINKNVYNRIIQDWRLDSTRLKFIKENYQNQGDKYIVNNKSILVEKELYDIFIFLNILCFNPMRAGINLSDYITTVSKTYSEEIKLPNDEKNHIIRGCGLENDLKSKNNIKGILNGILYNNNGINILKNISDEQFIECNNPIETKIKNKEFFLENIENIVVKTRKKIKNKFKNYSTVTNKLKKINMKEFNNKPIFALVSRMTEQKIDILLLNKFYKKLEDLNALFIFVGSGNLENRMNELNSLKNFLYINAFERNFGIWIYLIGDFFLMPSTFEPCGISQLVAMSYGTIPIVSNVGGLHDTVKNEETGFVFDYYDNPDFQEDLLLCIKKAINLYYEKNSFEKMVYNCLSQKFDWQKSAIEYCELYKKIV